MYGMVNKAIEEMVSLHHGMDAWERIKAQAGIEVELFVANEAYPDDITYRLVGAASEILAIPANDILVAFGEHWILHTAQKGYGALLRAGGSNLREFLTNLPNFHTRVVMIFPKLQPPEFRCTDITDHSLRLHYHTHRPGMAHFVIGLIRGLGKLYRCTVRTRIEKDRNNGAEHDVFHIEWDDPAPAPAPAPAPTPGQTPIPTTP